MANFDLCVFLPQIRRLRIEIEKLQWLHQQELSEMKHNLGKFPASRNVPPHLRELMYYRAQYFHEYSITIDVSSYFFIFVSLQCRTDNGRDEAESGAGKGTAGG